MMHSFFQIGSVRKSCYTGSMLSRNLEHTLNRALILANDRRHEFATLEHLLLAMTEDQDAMAVLRSCGISLPDLREHLTHYLDTELK